MRSVPPKVTGDLYLASEFNELTSQELQNVVLTSGQTLNAIDPNQLGKAMAVYGSAGDFYSDGGAADAYVLSPIGSPARRAPPALIDGLRVRFFAGNANTGASTVDLNSLGPVALTEDGAVLSASRISAGSLVECVYRSVAADFAIASVKTGIFDTDAQFVSFTNPLTGAVERPVAARLADTIHVNDWGATALGVVDDGAAIRLAAAALSDGGTLVLAGLYLIESTVTDPGTGVTNQHGVLLTGLSDITIDASAATLIQTAATTALDGGIFCFDGCTDCRFVGRGTGFNDGVSPSAALVCVTGVSDGIVVAGIMEGGRALCQVRSSDNSKTGTKPKNVTITGIARSSDRGVLTFNADQSISAHVTTDGVHRGIFVEGGLTNSNFTLIADGCITAGIRLRAFDGTTIEGLTFNLEVKNSIQPVSMSPSTDAADAGTIKNIVITGHVDNVGAGGTAVSVVMNDFANVGSVLQDIDMSGLLVTHDNAARAVECDPDAAATIQGLKLPKVKGTANATGTHVRFDNTAGAVIDDVEVNHIEGLFAGGVYDLLRVESGGTGVSNLRIVNRRLKTATTGNFAVDIRAGDGIVIDKSVSNEAISVAAAVTNVYPNGNNDVDGVGFVFSGNKSGAVDVSWLDTIILTSGAAAITSLVNGHPGDVVEFIGDGGTQSFTDSANLQTAGGAGYTMAANGSIMFKCVDGTKWIERSRSVN